MKSELTPKVSVIMPVYNGEQFIEQAVQSVLDQTLQNWELVVVNDGSTDATVDILDRFADRRFQILSQENHGEAYSRNVGLSYARGEYVAFLDADDYYFPNALEDLSHFLDAHPQFDVVYSDGQICDSNGVPVMRLSEIRPGLYNGKILEQLVISSNVVTVPVCTMTRLSVIRKYSIQFDRNLTIGPDWDFWIQLAVHAGFGYLDIITCKYRIHNTNITKRVDLKKRRQDQAFGRLKVMNSEWFQDLSIPAREHFFLDLLANLVSGEAETQQGILQSEPFAALPAHSRCSLWRSVAIDVLQKTGDVHLVRTFLLESLKVNPKDRKTRLMYASLRLGRWITLGVVWIWQFFHTLPNIFILPSNLRLRRLQKLFGLR